MPISQYENRLRALVSPSRFEHVCRVAQMSRRLAVHHSQDEDKAFLAGLLHDSAKQQSPASMAQLGFSHSDCRQDDYDAFPKVWHALVSPQFCASLFEITDKDIHSAMACHTTGRAKMSPLDQLVFLADYVELGRPYANCAVIRELAFSNLDEACYALSSTTLHSLIARSLAIHPDSLACYNYYVSRTTPARVKEIFNAIQMA